MATNLLKEIAVKAKRYKFDYILKLMGKGYDHRNIGEIISRFPNRGKGFHVFHPNVPRINTYHVIYQTSFIVIILILT